VLGEAPRRMLDLQPLIARFVDDVLLALRGATFEELRELLSANATSEGVPSPRPRKPRPTRQGRGAARRAAPRPAPARARVAPSPLRFEQATEPTEPPALAEITDPEGLLAAALAPTPPVAAHPPHIAPATPEGGQLPRGIRLALSAVGALREGESLARVAGAGLVIRRAKRA